MILSVLGLLNIITKTTRTNELEENIDTASYQTMKEYFIEGKTSSTTEPEKSFVADFTANLMQLTSSDSEYNVKVLNLDLNNGAFSVEVTEKYKNTFGLNRTVVCEKTLVLDNNGSSTEENETIRSYLVEFYWNDERISSKRLPTNGTLEIPNAEAYQIPEGYTQFVGWTKTKGSDVTIDMSKEKITDDTTYYAVFK